MDDKGRVQRAQRRISLISVVHLRRVFLLWKRGRSSGEGVSGRAFAAMSQNGSKRCTLSIVSFSISEPVRFVISVGTRSHVSASWKGKGKHRLTREDYRPVPTWCKFRWQYLRYYFFSECFLGNSRKSFWSHDQSVKKMALQSILAIERVHPLCCKKFSLIRRRR